jgi:hypothetical protein
LLARKLEEVSRAGKRSAITDIRGS